MNGSEILKYLPEKMADAINAADINWDKMEEIRIRTGKPVLLYEDSKEYFLTKRDGIQSASMYRENPSLYIVKESEIKTILDQISGFSLYAYEEELRQGYFTLEGGHRVGIGGKAVMENQNMKALKYPAFLNIRIAHEKKGCGKKIIRNLIGAEGLRHTLIISPPGCGKTTLLRDLIRLCSDGFFYEREGRREFFPGVTVGVADERSEIGAAVRGVPVNNLGIRTDLIDGCPKHMGMFMLLRSMAPKIIAVDEIGNDKDFQAIHQAVNSGCTILATAHGTSVAELENKKMFASFLRDEIFQKYVLLSGRKGKGTVEGVYSLEELRKRGCNQ